MEARELYTQATIKTASDLRSVAHSSTLREISHLSLPQVDTLVERVAKLIPAGNVPGMILNGLARLGGRRPPLKTIKRDIQLLFQGVEQILDRAVYGAFFAGPAAVISGYQLLLRLAGIDADQAFPQGPWQFYVEYALREDTARHANETHGFDTLLLQHGLSLHPADRLTAWAMAAIHCLHQYPRLLENEWRERVYLRLLAECWEPGPVDQLRRDWLRQRPYGRAPDCPASLDYPGYRRARFDDFLGPATNTMPANLRRRWLRQVRAAEAEELPAYQQQLSILAYLEPGPYAETRRPVPLERSCVGLVLHGYYYLLPVCAAGTAQASDVQLVRAQVAALLSPPADSPTSLIPLARMRRAHWPNLRQEFAPDLQQSLEALRRASILLNFEWRQRHLPLVELRQGERGVGDHALTIFDTGQSFVFDQSHIFFDGIWGVALAEILTHEALSWAVYLQGLPPPEAAPIPPSRLHLPPSSSLQQVLQQAPRCASEVGVESSAVQLKPILALRKLFKRRNDLLALTVNDLLVLYRAVHAFRYRPEPVLLAELRRLAQKGAAREAARTALEVWNAPQINPAILIPVDASQHKPGERLYPMSLEIPLAELDLLAQHDQSIAALEAYDGAAGDRSALYEDFDLVQRCYLAALAGFGHLFSQFKERAVQGESFSLRAIQLMAHMPAPLQRLLDRIPGRFDVLNDMIKGREVFSNVGAVAPGSTLLRFITAKDDNEKKTLAWGVLTDAQGRLTITLRDFRPHVGLLQRAGYGHLAVRMAQDYLDSYCYGLNQFIQDLQRITRASRQTRSTVQGERANG
ncbi:MAG: hypothetical protein JXA37_09695 [Chloroflexia bacterium]|nr:hypothetical protein [Chloroflexia bacterium]